MPNNLFALTDIPNTPVRRIPLTDQLSTELTTLFSDQEDEFLNGHEEVDFTGSYNVDQGEIFAIDEYPLPEAVPTALSNPLTCNMLNLKQESCRIRALFSGVWTEEERKVSFQLFDTGKLLSNRFVLFGAPIHANDTYKKLEDPGLVLQQRLTAQFKDGKLYFKSYHNTRRFLDLNNYYREATDVDLEAFTDVDLFVFEDEAAFKEGADSIIRKKVALLQQNNVLEDLSVPDIQNVATDFNTDLPDDRQISINIDEDGKLIIPSDKKELKKLIRFLDEDYVTAPLTQRKCLTNSKQYL